MPRIIEDSGNRFWRITADFSDHAWTGVPVKRINGGWADKAGAREQLVRKAATRVVEAA